MHRHLALLALLAAISPAIAQDLTHASQGGLPDEVVTHIHEMADFCRQVKGNAPSDPPVEHGNLAAGLEFWAIDEGTFRCEGAASLFSGSHGSEVAVYLSLSAGRVKQVFAQSAYGMTIERAGNYSKVWVRVGGKLCGQKGDPIPAETIACDRALRWDANGQKLDFAPLSEARIPDPKLKASLETIPYDSGTEVKNPKAFIFREYWSDKTSQINWKEPVSKRGMIYNWPLPSADGRVLTLTVLQTMQVCDPFCPARVFTAKQKKIMDILVCSDRTQHGVSVDHRSIIACGRSFPIPQVDEIAAIKENAPLDSDPDAYVEAVRRFRSKPADTPNPVRRDTAFHNNSQMLVSEWKDGAVEITYDSPRPGLPVAQGTVLFRGVRDGGRYSGTAYTFKAGCPPAPYPVTGIEDRKRELLVLSGGAPHRDPHSCEVIGQSDQSGHAKLVFDMKSYGDE
jgi:hypothetical protein